MADPYCLCNHSEQAHRSKVVNGKVHPFCVLCKECTGSGVINPKVPWALLVDGEEIPDG